MRTKDTLIICTTIALIAGMYFLPPFIDRRFPVQPEKGIHVHFHNDDLFIKQDLDFNSDTSSNGIDAAMSQLAEKISK